MIKKYSLVLLLSVALSFLVFGNSISGDFVFDDIPVVKNRGDLKDPTNFFKLFISPYHQNTPQTGLFRPLTTASYAINHYLGDSPSGFHIVNILIHALNSFLVFCLIRFLFKNNFLSWVGSLLFLTHPIHTEAVTSIVGRAELLVFLWSFISIYFFLKRKPVLSGVAFFLGLLSKEVAIMSLPLVIYIDAVLLNNKFTPLNFDSQNLGGLARSIKKYFIFIFPLMGYAVLRYLALGKYFLADEVTTLVENPLKFVPVFVRLFTGLKVLTLYLGKLVFPLHLSADYSYDSIKLVTNLFSSGLALGGLLILIALVFLVFSKKIAKEIRFGAALFLFPFLIISNFIKPIGTIMGERLMYLPSFGFIFLVSYGLFRLFGKLGKKPVYVILSVILVLYGARTVIRNRDWHDVRRLFTANVRQSPNSLITRNVLAATYIEDGEWKEAKEQLEIARAIYEDNSYLQNLLGIVADHEGDYKLAEERYLKSVELNPKAINSHINLAELYLKQKRLQEAGGHFLQVIEFYPTREHVVRYAYIQIATQNPDDGLGIINKYFGSNLNHSDLNSVVGTAYFVKKDYSRALTYLLKAQELGSVAPEIKQMTEIAKSLIR